MLEEVIGVIHFILGSILLFFSGRAYLRTKHPSMLYLTVGFAILAVGHLLFQIITISIKHMELERFDEILDIFTLIAFIIAVKKS